MTNPNNPNFSYDIYGDVDGAVDAAYAQNVLRSDAAVEPTLGEVVGQATSDSRSRAEIIGIDPDFLRTVEIGRVRTHELFGSIHLRTPELSEFIDVGINFEKLKDAHQIMTNFGHEPELVFAPVLTLPQWQETYKALQHSPDANNDGSIKNDGLAVYDEIVKRWDEFQGNRHSVAIDGQDWQVLVLPGSVEPLIRNVAYDGKNITGQIITGELDAKVKEISDAFDSNDLDLHPTIASYLTLQATKLYGLERPIDIETQVWLDARFSYEGTLGLLRGNWNSDIGRVFLGWTGPAEVAGYKAARPVVWG